MHHRLPLDDQRPLDVEAAFGSVVVDAGTPIPTEMVDADAVFLKIDDVEQALSQLNELGGLEGTFEDGVLHPLAVVEAGLRNAAEAPLASVGGGGDVVGDQDIHGRFGVGDSGMESAKRPDHRARKAG